MNTQSEALDQLVDSSSLVLLRVKTFAIFPTELVIDPIKVSLIDHFLFRSGQITSLYHKDLATVDIDLGPIFASMSITTRFAWTEPYEINYLPKSPAIEARRLIQGLLIANVQGLDLSNMGVKEIKEKIIELGKVHARV